MVLAIIQARMSSSRLPGKVLKKIKNKPILEYQIDRIKKSKKINKIVLATSTNKEDDVLVEFAKSINIEHYRGDLNNVLERYYNCAKENDANIIVRLTGDCPAIDPHIIDDVIDLYQSKKCDYASNTFDRSYPDGLDVEVFGFDTLENIYQKATNEDDLEHVTRYIYKNKNEFLIENLVNDIDYSYIRWTLDTLDDFYFFKHLYETPIDLYFSWKHLLSKTKDNKKFIIESNQNIRFAMKKLEEVVHDEKESLYIMNGNKVVGTLSTSDIRRALIYDDITNNDQVIKVMNKSFKYLEDERVYTKSELFLLLGYKLLPRLDKHDNLVRFETIKLLLAKVNKVILMAGGLGSRLKEITINTPKPMLKIGGTPILETIIKQFQAYHFDDFYISVNHMPEQIMNYFENGDKFNINIKYLEENKRLGTAGCLSLIKEKIYHPFFLMNADILTDINFDEMLKFHEMNSNEITIATIEHSYTVPYGVIDAVDNQVINIKEKPEDTYVVSAGIYILNPELLNEIPTDAYYDITDLFKKLLEEKRKIGIYKIEGYWLDIGQPDDFYKAHSDFNSIFKVQNDK